ncbi:hypothetical protein [Streptomyces sp. bgisy082]|uniref:hypothetical protein n=1 Tax=Streptomyces sp. bgisy082 TaxID=3413776 RepID=UPI003D73557C
MRRVMGGAAAGATALMVMTVLGAGPAAASETVNWAPVKTNSNWECSGYWTVPPSMVKFKSCIVRNASNDAQAVLVVQNPTSTDHTITKGRVVFESQRGGDVWCARTNLAAGATAGCYAPTVKTIPACTRTTDATVSLWVNNGGSTTISKDGENMHC